MPWLEQVVSASEWGYDAVVVDLLVLQATSGVDPASTLDAAGLIAGPAGLPVEFRADARRFEREFEQFPSYAELARRTGVTTLTRSLPPSGAAASPQLREILTERVSRCAAVAASWGLEIGLEGVGVQHMRTGDHPFIWKLRDVTTFARGCGDNVGLVLDSWHWHAAGESWDDLAKAIPHAVCIHVADAPDAPLDDLRDGARAVPGDGVIDLKRWAKTACVHGSAIPIVPEVFNDLAAQVEAPPDRARRILSATKAQLPTKGST